MQLQLSEEYAQLNPCKKLPCFITKTGKILTQSLAIIEYLEAMYPGRCLYVLCVFITGINISSAL